MNKCICTLAFACFALLTQTGCHINYESYKDKWPVAPGTTSTTCPEKLVCETRQDGTQICEKRKVCDTTNCQQGDPCYNRNDNTNNTGNTNNTNNTNNTGSNNTGNAGSNNTGSNSNTGSNNPGSGNTNNPPTTETTTDAGEPCPTDP